MFAEITNWIIDLIRSHGPVSVFIGVMIESIIVPIPSPLIIMAAGAILVDPGSAPREIFWDILRLIVVPGSLASTLGAYIGYGVGYWGGRPLIERFERFLGFGWDDVAKLEKKLEKRHLGLMIFLLRALPIIPLSLISAAVGVLRFAILPFSGWTFLGSIPRCFFLAYLGWLTRDAYEGLAGRLDFFETLISAGLVAGILLLIFWFRSRMRK